LWGNGAAQRRLKIEIFTDDNLIVIYLRAPREGEIMILFHKQNYCVGKKERIRVPRLATCSTFGAIDQEKRLKVLH
jgi:hypothetical protein